MTTDLLQDGIAALKAGRREEARKLFLSFVRANPQSERGWEWMYRAARSEKERRYCLHQILEINPHHEKASQALRRTGATRRSSAIAYGTVGGAFLLLVCLGIALVLPRLTRANTFAGYGCLFSPCAAAPVSQAMVTPSVNAPLSPPAEKAVLPAVTTPALPPAFTFTPTSINTPVSTATPINFFTPTLDTRLPATAWRKWAIVPEFSPRAQEILRQAALNPALDPHTFSKVGDCQMVAGTFLAGYVNGDYRVPEESASTIAWFSESMLADNITAVNGYGINTVLDPEFGLPAGNSQCLENETPLDCELRTRRPILVMVGMGTNWIPHGEASFERYLRQMVDRILQTGALPVLATKADNVEGDWKLNQVIAQVAYDYDLPLVNVWRSVQDLPNSGLEEPPRQVYLTGDGWMRRNKAWLLTLDNVLKVMNK